jgi:hypothetical protein
MVASSPEDVARTTSKYDQAFPARAADQPGAAAGVATGVGLVAAGSPRGRLVAVAHGVVGLAVVLLVPWKTRIVRRGLRRPRRTDLGRRTLLQAGALTAVAGGVYLATSSVVRLGGLPGTGRRFTGSYDSGSFDPASMPSTVWLDDRTPRIDPRAWRLVVADRAGERELSLAGLAAFDTRVRAVLDCTGGWYAEQDWTGAPVSALLGDRGGARSVLVRSATGYRIRFPIGDLDRLLLATRVGGAPLEPRHGFPSRLVAPGRRGFWWVKWVDRIELQDTPWWWQPPFPTT